ncbi:MAG: tRNA uridine-5-carboxymethylaminomethyl(34) synthesis GTPase MnmE [Bacteroides sp.]|nr:MAG: tRNA uridine-5-carboxymethylaminomethyl(34) synthesis GTPase MnmE [Bacteroides sp.]
MIYDKKNYNTNDTIIALSTNIIQSSIAVIRLSGNKSINIVNKIFKDCDLNSLNTYSIKYGKIMYNNMILDDVILSLFKNPTSYTGEDIIEISCHASYYITNTIIKMCLEMGARMANPGEFTMRAFLNGKMDLSQAESIADIIASESAKSHYIAINQLKGNISKKIQFLRKKLINLSSIIELNIDFSEENIQINDNYINSQIKDIYKDIEELLNSFSLGNSIKNGIKISIIGKPNVGKSTLINSIINEECSIVSEIPGTTRDCVKADIIIDGMKYIFMDTAGIRQTNDFIEIKGINKTYDIISKSDIILYLFDPSKDTASNIKKEIENLKINNKSKIIILANKLDCYDIKKLKKKYSSIKNIIYISAKKYINIDVLKNVIIKNLQLDHFNYINDNIITNMRHYESLKKANFNLKNINRLIKLDNNEDLIAYEINEAIYHLGSIMGLVYTDDKLDHIFKNFCIGK